MTVKIQTVSQDDFKELTKAKLFGDTKTYKYIKNKIEKEKVTSKIPECICHTIYKDSDSSVGICKVCCKEWYLYDYPKIDVSESC